MRESHKRWLEGLVVLYLVATLQLKMVTALTLVANGMPISLVIKLKLVTVQREKNNESNILEYSSIF